jgi:lipopolysaccharide transport system ATP-binding protein
MSLARQDLVQDLSGLRSSMPLPTDAGAWAVLCSGVVKSYRVFSNRDAWRIVILPWSKGRTIEAVRGVSLSVRRGEILGVLGRNGSGKSTLLRVLGGIYSANSGWVRLFGTIGSLFELGGLGNPHMTGRDYAERVLSFQGAQTRSLPALLAEIREFSELGDYFDRRLHTYSSGMAARLYFATMMSRSRDVFLIDELLSVGDAQFQAKSWRRIRERLASGASGVLVTHDWSSVVRLCRRAVIMDAGEILAEGPADEIVARYLDLPKPDGSIASFGELPSRFVAVSGEDFSARLPVERRREGILEFACSVELLRLGVGWEILILSEFLPIGRASGETSIDITIPRLPLAPGHYSLNLFLRSADSEGARLADARTWTTGTGLHLVVTGTQARAVTRLRTSWQVDTATSDAHA